MVLLILAEPVKDQKPGSDGAELCLRKRLFMGVMSGWFRKRGVLQQKWSLERWWSHPF